MTAISPKTAEIRDDVLTLISISALACILQDILHEGLGHGVTAWLSGARQLTLSTVALQSDIDTRWISANGTLVNLFFGLVFWLALRREYRPPMRYFLVLAMAGNLFTGTGYFMFSGVFNFGDWAAVIKGLQPYWAWRLMLIVIGAASYYASMLLVRSELRVFQAANDARRIRALCWTPYFADAALATLGGVLNPAGLFYVVASALPSTLGANAGLLSLPSMMPATDLTPKTATVIERNAVVIAAAVVASLLFILVLGRGISWSR